MSIEHATDIDVLQDYYRLHSRIYDATRWSFLFGRDKLVQSVKRFAEPQHILEVGCGTGTNLLNLAKYFPLSQITGLDMSEDMLSVARKRIRPFSTRIKLFDQKYDGPLKNKEGRSMRFDMVLFSYALTMFNPGWEIAIKTAREQLDQNGIIAVVDFHSSRFTHFQRWMRLNHVCMQAHILPQLESQFHPLFTHTKPAYAGVWDYFLFIGK